MCQNYMFKRSKNNPNWYTQLVIYPTLNCICMYNAIKGSSPCRMQEA